MQRYNIGVHGSHNGAIVISYGGHILEAVEIERWTKQKNAGLWHYMPVEKPEKVIKEILKYFDDKYNGGKKIKYHHLMENSVPKEHYKLFNADIVKFVDHHIAHASNVFYQSEWDVANVVSFDGLGNDGCFNLYRMQRGKEPILIRKFRNDLALGYQAAAHYIPEIQQENIWWGNLTYAGKLMGLCAYGNPRYDLLDKCVEWFRTMKKHLVDETHEEWVKHFGDRLWEGQEGRDLAYAIQRAFEIVFDELVTPYLQKEPGLKVLVSGGGGMNVINNTSYGMESHCQSDDRGIALGCLLHLHRPNIQFDGMYLGSEPYDELPPHEDIDAAKVAKMISEYKVLGLIQGKAEYGARALGNRSMIAHPSLAEHMNVRKGREMFRPVALMVRDIDARKYFDIEGDLNLYKNMTRVASAKDKRHGHYDGTCRIQVVTKQSNPFIYKLLGYHPVLINTSLNIKGQPILNTYEDALALRTIGAVDEVITDKHILK